MLINGLCLPVMGNGSHLRLGLYLYIWDGSSSTLSPELHGDIVPSINMYSVHKTNCLHNIQCFVIILAMIKLSTGSCLDSFQTERVYTVAN